MTTVALHFAPEFCAAIILDADCPTVYTNQCGGTYCAHPEARGFLLPIGEMPGDALIDLWNESPDEPNEAYDADRVRRVIESKAGWDAWFEPLDSWDGPWGETWIPVRIKGRVWTLFEGFAGRTAIITYSNSD